MALGGMHNAPRISSGLAILTHYYSASVSGQEVEGLILSTLDIVVREVNMAHTLDTSVCCQ